MKVKLLIRILLVAQFSIIVLVSCQQEKLSIDNPKILGFTFLGVKSTKITTDSTRHIIDITLPYGVSLNELVPEIQISSGTTIVPGSGRSQDFRSTVYYTLISASGEKVVYQIKVKTENQPLPLIIGISQSKIEAGNSVVLKGKYFGNYGFGVKAILVDSLLKEYPIKSILKDSTEIELQVPIEQAIGQYRVRLSINNQTTESTFLLGVSYPSPQVKSLLVMNLLQGDTIRLQSLYTHTKKYTIKLLLKNATTLYELPLVEDMGGTYSILTGQERAGDYSVSLLNKTENKQSLWSDATLHLYDVTMPFVLGTEKSQTRYRPNETIIFKTHKFDRFNPRFYQVSLSKGQKKYFLNGFYDSPSQTLKIQLPIDVEQGEYSVGFILTQSSSSSMGEQYGFQIDTKINITE